MIINNYRGFVLRFGLSLDAIFSESRYFGWIHRFSLTLHTNIYTVFACIPIFFCSLILDIFYTSLFSYLHQFLQLFNYIFAFFFTYTRFLHIYQSVFHLYQTVSYLYQFFALILIYLPTTEWIKNTDLFEKC